MNARHASLIRSLLREGYLKTPRIIDAFRQIDRADFVLPEYGKEAYENSPLSIGDGQTISQPLTVAFMLELLNPKPGERILDIGAGSGWTCALLAHIVSEKTRNTKRETRGPSLIYAMERIPELCSFGEENLKKYNFIKKRVVEWSCRDATAGLPGRAPFDKILASAAAASSIPAAWREQVKIGGVIVAPVGGSLWRFTKKTEEQWIEEEFPGFAFVPLVRDRESIRRRPAGFALARLLIFLFVSAAALGVFFIAEIAFPHGTQRAKSVSVEILPGSGSRKIAETLKEKGVIRSKWAFIVYVSLRSEASSLKPGAYAFTNESIIRISRDLVSGVERVFTIPEGWTQQEIAEAFARAGIMAQDDFLHSASAAGSRPLREEFPFLSGLPPGSGLEGYLFPDTYRFPLKIPAESAARRMLQTFEKKIMPDMRDAIQARDKTLHEIITMASLIEKEVVSDADRALVSGILWKRMEHGIPLQVDATIVYIKKYERGLPREASRTISILDTKIRSPYNTYLFPGLPQGPIGNPGISAIRAALSPQESPYFYYLSTPEGKTIFSKTLEEHNRAKATHLR